MSDIPSEYLLINNPPSARLCGALFTIIKLSSTVIVSVFRVTVVPFTTKSPPTCKFFCIPTPPLTISAPLLILDESLVASIVMDVPALK